MPVSGASAKVVYEALRAADVRLMAALPESWLTPVITLAQADPEVTLVEVVKEEEAIGVAMGAHLGGSRAAVLMQNHGLFASINGVVSGAMLFRIPLLLVISDRGHLGEPDPWQTEGGKVTRRVLDALGIVWDELSRPEEVERRVADAAVLAESSLSPVALLLTRRLMWDAER
ncbi:MAG TPA: thiamine pyrophosphate-binding protein [Acidimicrobiia bacterium]|nr:thiamine pyrophosphate-binding protein [Acidimicrobiia bacterium]